MLTVRCKIVYIALFDMAIFFQEILLIGRETKNAVVNGFIQFPRLNGHGFLPWVVLGVTWIV